MTVRHDMHNIEKTFNFLQDIRALVCFLLLSWAKKKKIHIRSSTHQWQNVGHVFLGFIDIDGQDRPQTSWRTTTIFTKDVSSDIVDKWCTGSCHCRVKQSLRTCTHRNWSMCNRHKNRSRQHWLKEKKIFFFFMRMSDHIWHEGPVTYSILFGRHCATHHAFQIFLQHITTPQFLLPEQTLSWAILRKWGWFTEGTREPICTQNTRFLIAGHCESGIMLAQGAACRLGFRWRLTVHEICYVHFCF